MNMSQKGFANIALIILIVILVGMGGFYFFRKSKLTVQTIPNLENKILPITQTQSDSPSTILTQDKTADWKTYENAKYGIKFKYPAILAPTEKEKTHPVAGKSFEIIFRENNVQSFVVVVYLKNPTGDIDQSLNYLKTGYSDSQKTTVNNYPALSYLNGSNVIIFSGQKSYSFGKSRLTTADFNAVINSVDIQN